MAIVPMTDATPGGLASAADYNKVTANIRDLDARLGPVASSITAHSRLVAVESRTTDTATSGGIGNQRLADRLGASVGTGTNPTTGTASSQLADIRSRLGTLETAPAPTSGPLGFVGEVKRTQADTISATETGMESLTVNLTANRRYKVTWEFAYQVSSAPPAYPSFVIRYAAGTTVTNTSPFARVVNIDATTVGRPMSLIGTFSVPTTGQYTIRCSAVRSSGGSVSVQYQTGVTDRIMLVEDIGPA